MVKLMLEMVKKKPEALSQLTEVLQASGMLPAAEDSPPAKRPARAAAVVSRVAIKAAAAADDEDEDMGEEEEAEEEEPRAKRPAHTPKQQPQPQLQPRSEPPAASPKAAPAAAPREAPGAAMEDIGGVNQADEMRAMLPGRGGGGGGGRGGRESWLSATSVHLGTRLMSRADERSGTASMLAAQGVGSISPGAEEALTTAVVDRLVGVLEGVREHVDWRTARGHITGGGPAGWIVVPGDQSLQQRVWDIAAREQRLQEQRQAAAKLKKLAEEEAAIKNRRPGAPALTAEEQARVTSLAKLRAEQEAVVTNTATTTAARQAMGHTVAGAKADKWATMQRNAAAKAAATGDGDGDGMDVDRPGGDAGAHQAGAPAAHAMVASREVTVRDVATYLQRDPCATPRLLGVAAERLRRTEQPGGQSATAALLKPLVPRLL